MTTPKFSSEELFDPKRVIGKDGIKTERKSPAQRALDETKARIMAEKAEESDGAGL